MSARRKSILPVLISAGLLLASCSGGSSTGQASQSDVQQGPTETRSVQVSASGSVQAEPDTALVRLGVETLDPQAQRAIDANRRRMESVQSALADQGVAEADIQTVQFSVDVEQVQPGTPDAEATTRFRVTHILQVQTDQVATVGEMLQAALDAGANRVQNIQFSIADPTTLESQARSQALAAARDKANELANGLDAEVGAVRQIVESGVSLPRPVMAASVESAAAMPIASGSLSVSVTVDVTFDLIPTAGQAAGE